jgi:hypothetical protein
MVVIPDLTTAMVVQRTLATLWLSEPTPTQAENSMK